MHVTRSFGVAYSICILGGEVAWSRAERPHLRLRRIFVFAGVRASFFRGGLLRRRGLSVDRPQWCDDACLGRTCSSGSELVSGSELRLTSQWSELTGQGLEANFTG